MWHRLSSLRGTGPQAGKPVPHSRGLTVEIGSFPALDRSDFFLQQIRSPGVWKWDAYAIHPILQTGDRSRAAGPSRRARHGPVLDEATAHLRISRTAERPAATRSRLPRAGSGAAAELDKPVGTCLRDRPASRHRGLKRHACRSPDRGFCPSWMGGHHAPLPGSRAKSGTRMRANARTVYGASLMSPTPSYSDPFTRRRRPLHFCPPDGSVVAATISRP